MSPPLPKDQLDERVNITWESYAKLLTRLASRFPADDLPSIDYLLDEDQENVGFLPLVDKKDERISKSGARYSKAPIAGEKQERLAPEVESLVRVRDLFVDAMSVSAKEAPIRLEEGSTFVS